MQKIVKRYHLLFLFKEDEMLPIMFIGFPPNQSCTIDEKFLKKMAERYGGDVKGV